MGEKHEPDLSFPSTSDAGQDRYFKDILEENSSEARRGKARRRLEAVLSKNHIVEGESLIPFVLGKYLGISPDEVGAAMEGIAGFSKLKRHDQVSYKLSDKKAALESLSELTQKPE
jgi:hypothetical protein